MSKQTIEDVAKMMDERYVANTAYVSELPFDWKRTREIHRATLILCGERAHDASCTTLDVGCGKGGIAGFWPHHNTVGVDISPVAVDIASKSFPRSLFIACPIERMFSVFHEKFGLVVAQESIEHWTDYGLGLDAIGSVMQPGGWLVLTTPNRDSLHCRMSRKLGLEAPYCSSDHIHEFGYQELIDTVQAHGFRHVQALGVHLAPYWSFESEIGDKVRKITDKDPEVNDWLNSIARTAPPEFAFIQCHRFIYEP